MFTTFRNMAIGAALGLCAGLAVPAQAAYIVTLQQVGANVVATGSGTLDLAALTLGDNGFQSGIIIASQGAIAVGPNASVTTYSGFTGPTSFGSGGGHFPANNSGDTVGVDGNFNLVLVPEGYLSGSSLSDTSTYDGATFASLGVTPGTYEWTWGTGADADNFTLQIGPVAVVPEPASLPLLVMGLAGLGMVVRTRRA